MMNWVQRKIYLYNVTFGLYMLDWWERYLFILDTSLISAKGICDEVYASGIEYYHALGRVGRTEE